MIGGMSCRRAQRQATTLTGNVVYLISFNFRCPYVTV